MHSKGVRWSTPRIRCATSDATRRTETRYVLQRQERSRRRRRHSRLCGGGWRAGVAPRSANDRTTRSTRPPAPSTSSSKPGCSRVAQDLTSCCPPSMSNVAPVTAVLTLQRAAAGRVDLERVEPCHVSSDVRSAGLPGSRGRVGRVTMCRMCVTSNQIPLEIWSDLHRRVEVAGVEPASSETSSGLLRAQPASLVSGHRRSPAVCGDPSPSEVSRRALEHVPAVSRSEWRPGSGRAAGPGGTRR